MPAAVEAAAQPGIAEAPRKLDAAAATDEQQQLDDGAEQLLVRRDAEEFARSSDTRANIEAGRGCGRPERRATRHERG